MTKIQYGININGHPNAAIARPSSPEELDGVSWVRMVFLLHAAVVSPSDHRNIFGYDLNNPTNYADALQRAFSHYDGLIKSYARQGIRTLLIFNQETFAGNAPWMNNGDWSRFAREFAEICGKIAFHYRYMPVDYEIWNEGDMPGGHSSIYMPPEHFAPVLQATSIAIHSSDPDCTVVFGGVFNGAYAAAQYVNKIRKQLGGLPVDAVGIHPYGQALANQPDIPGDWPGKLEESLDIYTRDLPDSLWITELGVSAPGKIHPEHYKAVADYMEGALDLIQTRYANRIPIVIWFGWSDYMREAGIVDNQGKPKAHIYDSFFKIARNSEPADVSRHVAKYRVIPVSGVRALNLREPDGLQFKKVGSVRRGDKLVVIENADLALAKIGNKRQWINVRTPDNKEIWCAAWLVEPAAESKAALDNDEIPVPFLITPTSTSLNVRDGDLTRLPHRIVSGKKVAIGAGEAVDIIEDPSIAFKKIELGAAGGANREYHWIHIRTARGIEGWCAAWYLAPAKDSATPPPLPIKGTAPIIINPGDDIDEPTKPDDPVVPSKPDDPTEPDKPTIPVVTVERLEEILQQAYDVKVNLASIDEFDEMQKLIAQILSYGIGIRNSHENSGEWSLDEVRQLHRVIENSAEVSGALFKEMYGVDNKVMAFKTLYAPMAIGRDGRKYVGPGGKRWYAKNSNGFDLIFGNSVFFNGEQKASPLRNTKRSFNSEQLIAHEIAHAINWRYRVQPDAGGTLQEVDRYYEKQVERADGLGKHDGYTFGAGSSSEEWETVTDAIASLNLNLFTADEDGKTRRQQITELMKLVIRYRKNIFDSDDLDLMLSKANRGNPGLFDRLKPVVAMTDIDAVDNWLGTLPAEIKGKEEEEKPETPPESGTNEWTRTQLMLKTTYVNVRSGPGLEFNPPAGKIKDKSIVHWRPESHTRDRANKYTWVNLKSDTVEGWIAYREGFTKFVEVDDRPKVSETLTNGVIDISHWQKITDWDALVNAGVIGIIHKATQGTGFTDGKYKENFVEASKHNLMWGSYHFGTGADSIKQAKYYLSTINDNNHLLVLDFEENAIKPEDSMSFQQAEKFVSYVHEKTGKWCVLYTGNWYLRSKMPRNSDTILKNCTVWLAAYTTNPPDVIFPWTRWSLWQYSNGVHGNEPKDLPGISRVDRNLFNGDLATLKAFWKQTD